MSLAQTELPGGKSGRDLEEFYSGIERFFLSFLQQVFFATVVVSHGRREPRSSGKICWREREVRS